MPHYVDFNGLKVGDSLPPLTKDTITKVQLVRYAGASGDFNPLHTDDGVARKAGLKGVIAQGILVMGFMGQAISGWVRTRDLKRFKVRFTGMTYPGDVITVKAVIREKKESDGALFVLCDTLAEDQNGETKVSGEFEVLARTGP
jgi:acyl dehydratase